MYSKYSFYLIISQYQTCTYLIPIFSSLTLCFQVLSHLRKTMSWCPFISKPTRPRASSANLTQVSTFEDVRNGGNESTRSLPGSNSHLSPLSVQCIRDLELNDYVVETCDDAENGTTPTGSGKDGYVPLTNKPTEPLMS